MCNGKLLFPCTLPLPSNNFTLKAIEGTSPSAGCCVLACLARKSCGNPGGGSV